MWPAKKNANLGVDLERLIIRQNDVYRRQGLAIVHKVPTEWIPLRDGSGKITGAKVEHKSVVDFIGATKIFGAIAFDAKHTDKTGIRKDRVEPHQAQFLNDWDALTGNSFILAGFRMTEYFFVPWAVWKALPSMITKEHICRWSTGERGRLPNYLSVLERQVKRVSG